MKSAFAGLLTMVLASGAMASHGSDQQTVRWRNVVGVITALNVDNPVCGTDQDGNCVGTTISAGTFAWVARSGRARVNLSTGATEFEVDGLNINGTQFSGTAGPVTQVEGTLVCNLGEDDEATLDTSPVTLSLQGDAEFSGHITGIPSPCANPLFLIRIVSPAIGLGRWIATGVDRTMGTGRGMSSSSHEDR